MQKSSYFGYRNFIAVQRSSTELVLIILLYWCMNQNEVHPSIASWLYWITHHAFYLICSTQCQ